MGVAASWMWSWLFPRKEYKIVVVGLDNAGKTTMLYKLYLGEVVITRPTVGSNVEEVKYRNLTFEDLADAMTAAELSTSLCLTDIKKHSWHIQEELAVMKGEANHLFDPARDVFIANSAGLQ
eukprot:jgi/Pico_ML_1/54148/g4566.t1